VRRANESLSVLRQYDQQRRTRCGAWCEERAGAAAGAGASRQARGVILPTGQLRKSKRGDVKRAGASARTSEHDRTFIMKHKTSSRWGSPRDKRPEPR
jgi:hypothetical protein